MAEAAYAYIEPDNRFEIIEGVKVMAASVVFGHSIVAGKLLFLFNTYFYEHQNGIAFCDVDVHFPDGNLFRPDLCVVSNPSLIDDRKIVHGVPELCVEILSPSTMKNDIGKKKRLYAKNGVREYWIVDYPGKNIFVYHLDGEHYELDETYHRYTDDEIELLTEDERAEIKREIKVSIVPDLVIEVERIFQFWWQNKQKGAD